MSDPFHALPGLRDRIKPFEQSFFRGITVERIRAMMADKGIPEGFPFFDDPTREALRARAMAGHSGDLWVFAYGSLIWDPALDFAEVRQAHAPHHARRCIMVDRYGGRGAPDAPGLMAALDEGPGCDGLAFRIAADKVEAETEILFRREMIGPGYLARHIPVVIDGRTTTALSFLADHDSDIMDAAVSRADQVRFAATGAGMLGTSLDYLQSTADHLSDFGISDPELDDLLAEARAWLAAR